MKIQCGKSASLSVSTLLRMDDIIIITVKEERKREVLYCPLPLMWRMCARPAAATEMATV